MFMVSGTTCNLTRLLEKTPEEEVGLKIRALDPAVGPAIASLCYH